MRYMHRMIHGLMIVCCLAGIICQAETTQPVSPQSYENLLSTANKAYDESDFETAAKVYSVILKQFPKNLDRESILADYAWCCLKLNKLNDANAALKARFNEFPNSPYINEALPLLYQALLSAGDIRNAQAIWQEAFTQLSAKPMIWGLVREHYKYIALQPHQPIEMLFEKLHDIFTLNINKADLASSIYQPLIQRKRYAAAFIIYDQTLKQLDLNNPEKAIEITSAIYRPLIDENNITDLLIAYKDSDELLKDKYPKVGRTESKGITAFIDHAVC